MQVFRGIQARADTPTALTIGNFDGVHLGHRAMIARASGAGASRARPPREFFAPDRAPARLTSLREKLELLRQCGVARAYVCHFDYKFAQLTADDSIPRVLKDVLAVKWLLVGDDFRFGARRAGDLAYLKATALRSGFDGRSTASVAG